MPAPSPPPSSDAVLRALFGVIAGLVAALIAGIEAERRGLRWFDPRRVVLGLAVREMRGVLRGMEGFACVSPADDCAVARPSPHPWSASQPKPANAGERDVRRGAETLPVTAGAGAAAWPLTRRHSAPLGRAPPRQGAGWGEDGGRCRAPLLFRYRNLIRHDRD